MPVYLQDELVFAPRLEEASGTRRDDSGRGWHLTPTWTTQPPARTAGKRGYGAQLDRNTIGNQRLGVQGVTDLGNLSQIWLAVWARPSAWPVGTTYTALGMALPIGEGRFLSVGIDTDGTWHLVYLNAVPAEVFVIGPGTAPGEWALVQAWLDVPNLSAGIQVNDEAPVTAALVSILQEASPQIYVGSRHEMAGDRAFDGALDCPLIWRKVPSADERAAVWNGGAGVEWPFQPAGSGSPLTLPPATWGNL